MILHRPGGRTLRFATAEPRLCVIQRGDYYLTTRPQRWTLFREHAAVFPAHAVAQTFLQDFPEEFAGAQVVPYVQDREARA